MQRLRFEQGQQRVVRSSHHLPPALLRWISEWISHVQQRLRSEQEQQHVVRTSHHPPPLSSKCFARPQPCSAQRPIRAVAAAAARVFERHTNGQTTTHSTVLYHHHRSLKYSPTRVRGLGPSPKYVPNQASGTETGILETGDWNPVLRLSVWTKMSKRGGRFAH
jgi:hypothetical protein